MNAAVQPWVDSARRSLDAADVLYAAQLWPQTCFNAQQCVEMMFKAAIAGTNVAPPRIHGIIELLNRLNAPVQAAVQHLSADLQVLDLYYAPTRYPDALPGGLPGGLPGEPEATAALETARDIVAIITPFM